MALVAWPRSLVLATGRAGSGTRLAVIGLVALVGLNLVAPAAFVAEHNVERVIDPSLVPADGHAGLDAGYLAVLPDDAVPVARAPRCRALPEPDDADIRCGSSRSGEASSRTDPAYPGPAAWNLGRERAREALSTRPDARRRPLGPAR